VTSSVRAVDSLASRPATLAVVGATGAVGEEMLTVLAACGVAPGSVRAFASARSAGRLVPFGEHAQVAIEALPESAEDLASALDRVDVVLAAADAATARRLAPACATAGADLVDNSSAFRLDSQVALVVPEINGALVDVLGSPTIVANPNCSTVLLTIALAPLRARFGLRRVVVATYQSASGAGRAAVDELEEQVRARVAGDDPVPRAASSVFPEPVAFNVFVHESALDPVTGLNGEESKVVAETRKIFGDPTLRIAPNCIRVPVVRAHSQLIDVELIEPAAIETVRELYARVRGEESAIDVRDDRQRGRFPTPLLASGTDRVLVGRIRAAADAEFDAEGRTHRVSLFACMDQLRKGAALNAVQIAARLIARPPA
jgi:aspartate-semialdehyde dehydrogenase